MLNEMRRTVTFLGDGVPVFKDIIAEKLNVPYSFAPAHLSRQRAGRSGCTWSSFMLKKAEQRQRLRHKPDYLRVSQAERERAEKLKKQKVKKHDLEEMLADDLDQVMEIEEELFSVPWTKEGFLTFLMKENAMFLVVEEKGQDSGILRTSYSAG